MSKKNCQLVGNMVLYLVCWELSKRGWNVMPTARNAKGIDILGYSEDGTQTITVQVKSLSKRSPVPMGAGATSLIADFFIVARRIDTQAPEFFVAGSRDIQPLIHIGHKNGKTSYWLQQKEYETFQNQWEMIGSGFRSVERSKIESQLLEVVNGPFSEWTDKDVEDIKRHGRSLIERTRDKQDE